MICRWLVAICALGACGGNDATTDAGVEVDASPFGAPSDTYPASSVHVPMSATLGGPVMTNVRVVPIYYADYAAKTALDDFYGKFAASPYWLQMVSEYAVAGNLTVATSVQLPQNAPPTLSDADVKALLTSQLDGTHAEYGPVDSATLARTIYSIHVPGTTVGTGPSPGLTSCVNFVGYHGATSGTNRIIYSIVYDCLTPSYLSSTLELVTAAVSHELVEAATDPISAMYAWTGLYMIDKPWGLAYGNELGDLCEGLTSNWFKPAEVGYMIQRSWSNASMHAFHNPCVPVPAAEQVFYASVPNGVDQVSVPDPGGGISMTPGTVIQLGKQGTVELQLLSSGPTEDWTIEAVDDHHVVTGGAPILTFAFDRATGRNGNLVHLSITPVTRPTSGYALYRVVSHLGTTKTLWWGIVGITP